MEHIDMASISGPPCLKPSNQLPISRKNGDESFYYFESKEIRSFTNAKKIYVLCLEEIESWHKASEEHYFPCGLQSLFFIDFNDDRMMRSVELEEMCGQALAESWAVEGYDCLSDEPLGEETGGETGEEAREARSKG